MKSIALLVFLILTMACSTKTSSPETGSADSTSADATTVATDGVTFVDPTSPYATVETILELSGGQMEQVYGMLEDDEYLFRGTTQEVRVILNRSESINPSNVVLDSECLSYQTGTNPAAPKLWKTKDGLYLGMPLDAVQSVHGKSFTIGYGNYKLDAKLNYTKVEFEVVEGSDVTASSFSDQLIASGRKIVISKISIAASDYLANKKTETSLSLIDESLPGDYSAFSTREVTAADMDGREAAELRIARNEIFARHGYIFKSEDLQEHFAQFDWYKAEFANVDSKMTALEKKNIAVLKRREDELADQRSFMSMIRMLPLLKLPLRYEQKPGRGIEIPDSKLSPDGEEPRPNYTREVYGLLPDTSRVYAVVWKADAYQSIGGVIGTTAITTIDKSTREPIATAFICVHFRYDEYGSDCGTTDSFESIINADWSYRSEYNASTVCPDGDDDENNDPEPSKDQKIVSGKVGKNGEITETETNRPIET